jgi:hypothetical protein
MNRSRRWSLFALLLAAPAGCGGPGEVDDDTPATVPVEEGFEGLSPEEIRAHAESMSPAVAESLGIIDTTIHVEERLSEDTIVIPPPRPDTGG